MRPAVLFCEKENRGKRHSAVGAPIARLGEAIPFLPGFFRCRDICSRLPAPRIPTTR